ncbi:MAG: short chain dehydrogenase [Xanthomonadaceae bacterium]|nr:short chain dehydrogenase [Xanthomonadaceae bacterium]
MKIILVGAAGTIGQNIAKALSNKKEVEIIKVGRTTGDFKIDMESPESIENFFKIVGSFDALISAAGEVAFSPLDKLSEKDWSKSLNSKLMGQIRLVQLGIPYIKDKGSFTLVSGVLADEPIAAGTPASVVNKALEGFVMSASRELPRGVRLNLVSPNLLTESVADYEGYFPGFATTPGSAVAQSFIKSVYGVQTGAVFRI